MITKKIKITATHIKYETLWILMESQVSPTFRSVVYTMLEAILYHLPLKTIYVIII